MIEAAQGRCQECLLHAPPNTYLPCNAPATKVVLWPKRPGEPTLLMCDACADHNTRNRGAEVVSAYSGPVADLKVENLVPTRPKATPADLIAEYNKLNAFIDAEGKRFAEHMRPANTRVEEVRQQLLAMMIEQRVEAFKIDEGTAYKSTITTPKITDKTQFLDWCLEDWDNRGAMLQIGAPQKDSLNEYKDANDGGLPPFVEESRFVRVNIRKG